MHYAIIAAGDGSRLSEKGPKPLVKPVDEALIERLLRIVCGRDDVENVTVVTNRRQPEVAEFVRSLSFPVVLDVIEAETGGAAYSMELVATKAPCVAMTVDAVFSPAAFNAFVDEFVGSQRECLMAVTDFIDDEKPLYVVFGERGDVRAFSDAADSTWVSAGVYALGTRALAVLHAPDCTHGGCLRNFQRQLLVAGVDVGAFDIGKTIDVDRPEDVAVARNFILNELKRCQE